MPWVDISQAAFTMGISERTIRNWIKSGKLNAKTENGQRMVEIPEEELRASAGGSAGTGEGRGEDAAFADSELFEDEDGDGERMLDTQKRLEVALLECGRVKGTLASQERIMETLSSNIAELTAKLQKSQNRSWKLIMLCLGVAFLGVIAVLARNSLHKDELADVQAKHRETLETQQAVTERLRREKDEARNEFMEDKLEQRLAFEKQMKEEVAAARQEVRQTKDAEIARLREDHRRTVDEKNDVIEKLTAANKELEARAIRLEEQTKTLQSNIARLEETLGSQARQLEKLEEYKTRIIELQDELGKVRRREIGGD